MKNTKVKTFKALIFILIIIVSIFLTIKLFPFFKNLATEKGRIDFKNQIDKLGYKGPLVIIGIMIAQIFLAILPGEPIEVISGMCYGPIGGLLIVYIGIIISCSIIFLLVKKFGRSFIYSFAEKEKIEKLEKDKIFLNPNRIDIIIFILFFIPGTPKDLLTYFGGLLPINPKKFIIISSIARFPSIISSTIVGNNIIYGNWKNIVAIYVVTLVISVILLYIFNIYSKSKNSEIDKNEAEIK